MLWSQNILHLEHYESHVLQKKAGSRLCWFLCIWCIGSSMCCTSRWRWMLLFFIQSKIQQNISLRNWFMMKHVKRTENVRMKAWYGLGLLENDQYWGTTLAEAVLICLPPQICTLFKFISTTCTSSDPSNLWEKLKKSKQTIN